MNYTMERFCELYTARWPEDRVRVITKDEELRVDRGDGMSYWVADYIPSLRDDGNARFYNLCLDRLEFDLNQEPMLCPVTEGYEVLDVGLDVIGKGKTRAEACFNALVFVLESASISPDNPPPNN